MKIYYKVILYTIEVFCLSLAILIAGELLLRLFMGAPEGYFNFLLLTDRQLYPPNTTVLNSWHKKPYVVKTNSLGLRGPEVPRDKTELKKRIVAIGDSVTDGYGVDNDATFPHHFQFFLDSKGAGRFEVLNAARGGSSIDKELAILRKVVLPLRPDIVLLTFCTNDISEISGRNREELINGKIGFIAAEEGLKKRFLIWLITRTAVGEVVCKFYLRNFLWLIAKTCAGDETRKFYVGDYQGNFYRADIGKAKGPEKDRYSIEGGDSFSKNVEIFNAISSHTDGIVLNEPFSAKTDLLISDYIFALGEFRGMCQTNNIEFVFIYFPSYSQVYDLATSLRIRDILLQACTRLSIPFLDLTPALRREGKNRVLHLAPLDFHLNPDGNKFMAETIAGFLISEKYIEW